MNSIVNLRLKEVANSLKDRKIDLFVESGARDWIAVNGYDTVYGARAINRLISKKVRQPLAAAILKGSIRNGDQARVRLNQAGSDLEVVELHDPEVEVVEGLL